MHEEFAAGRIEAAEVERQREQRLVPVLQPAMQDLDGKGLHQDPLRLRAPRLTLRRRGWRGRGREGFRWPAKHVLFNDTLLSVTTWSKREETDDELPRADHVGMPSSCGASRLLWRNGR
ncbi:hypothetical protein GCM10011504_38740 [Siccirubricoccus deserti]|nr:hypothetical protein GCM10011504_38740 [Siccirubricoccus deserti]